MTGTIATEADLERQLRHVGTGCTEPLAGLFGPSSVMWHVTREQLVFLGAGRALLLQLAHPWVARGICEHSRTLSDPLDRFQRTFNVMFTMVFGTLDQAQSAAMRLHRRHARVTGYLEEGSGIFAQGSPYWANEISALRWVHATLADTVLVAYALVFPALTEHQREQYYGECKLLARLFGIPQEQMPANWAAFADYNRAMHESDALGVGADARRLSESLLDGGAVWLRAPGWYRAVTARLLPPRLREAFGLPYGEAERRQAEAAIAWIRRVYPALPERLRCVGPYHEAKARLSGRCGPDLLTRLTNRLWIGQPWMDRVGS